MEGRWGDRKQAETKESTCERQTARSRGFIVGDLLPEGAANSACDRGDLGWQRTMFGANCTAGRLGEEQNHTEG